MWNGGIRMHSTDEHIRVMPDARGTFRIWQVETPEVDSTVADAVGLA